MVFDPSGEILLNEDTEMSSILKDINGFLKTLAAGCRISRHLGWATLFAITLPVEEAERFSNRTSCARFWHGNPTRSALSVWGSSCYIGGGRRVFAAHAAPLEEKVGERACICPNCQALYYPRINPAVMVSVHHGEKILLAHNRNFTGGYSVWWPVMSRLGDLEQAVRREVLGGWHPICNIRYWGSRPGLFPVR